MTNITLDNGFKATIDESLFDDMRFIEMLGELESKPLTIGAVTKKILGAEQKEALYSFLETESGRVPVEACTACITEIMEKCANGKKS